MNNLLTTIPKSKFKDWKVCERTCQMCDGETLHFDGERWFWIINTQRKPQKDIIGSVCFMIYDGKVRGYFDIVSIDDAEDWQHYSEPDNIRSGYSVVMANWHPFNGPELIGFQGWRYTHLRP